MDGLLYFIFGALLVAAMAWSRHHYTTFIAQTPDEMTGKSPDIDIRTHLNGPLQCEGVLYGPTGRISSRFVARIDASWDGNTGTMTEALRYDSGAEQQRSWHLELAEDGTIRATAPDVVGTGTGRQSGPGVLLKYRLKLPPESGGYTVRATDWMYLIENGTIINHSQFRMFGIKVAELVATIRPAQPAAEDRREAA